MKRDPSLHILKSELRKILDQLDYPDDDVNKIMSMAKSKSIHTRTIISSNDRVEKKAKKLLNSSRADANYFARLIYTRRKAMKHRGIAQINSNSKDWGTLKEITGHALDFAEEFNIPIRKAFITYIDIGISKMPKFMLNRFVGLYEGICERYQAIVEIQKDKDPFMTEQMYTFFNQHVMSVTGMFTDLKQIPERYVFFVRAREEAEKLNLSVKVYLDAQFSELDFTKSAPHPSQLIGTKARERVMRHCYKKGIMVKPNSND